MASETQNVWTRLIEANDDLDHIPIPEIDDFLLHLASEFKDSFFECFGKRTLHVRALSSFVINDLQLGTECINTETHYIGNSASLDARIPKDLVSQREILFGLYAVATAPPPAKQGTFDPLFRKVTIPIRNIVEILEVDGE